MPSAISAWAGSPWRRSVDAPLGRISEVVTPMSGRIRDLLSANLRECNMAAWPNPPRGAAPSGRVPGSADGLRGAPIYPRRSMSSQYIFTMYKLSRTHPPDKQVLKDISLSFMPGAKIGVLGLNGSGKSTLLRIMAGKDQDFRGEAQLAPGATVGMLEQEPQLDELKDVRGNVEDGVAETRALLDRFNELAANYSDETADEFARLQDRIDAADAWNLDTQLDQAMDALRLPPPDADVSKLSGGERRRVALCRLLLSAPDLLLLDEPTNHLDAESVGWLERHLEDYKGTIVAVTHDRYFLDNVAGWILELDRGPRAAVQGQLLVLARAEAGAPGPGGAQGQRPQAHDRRASSSGCARTPRAAARRPRRA
jgi:ATPase subunit of ABC transporter with duplicated ATPase domains